MKKTEVMFFFDTEDYICDESSDDAKQLAEILTEEGITGHFAVVGLLAQKLVQTGRQDVIDALNRHEIGTHTWGHSMHPNICEIADCADFAQAYRNTAEMEAEGIRLVQEAFDRKSLLFAVPPGTSKSYAAMYYYADAGIPFYCDTVVTDARNSHLHCANLIQMSYTDGVEDIAFNSDESMEDRLDRYAQMDRVIVYTHPHMARFAEHIDKYNFKGRNLHPDGDYVLGPLLNEEQRAHYYATFREIIRCIKADDRFRITTLQEILSGEPAREPIHRAQVPEIAACLRGEYAPLWGKACLYDVFMAAATFLRGGDSYLPGKAYGLLEAPQEIDAPVTLTVQGVRDAAVSIAADTFLPATVCVDGQTIGTGDMLYAMLAALETGEGDFTLAPHPAMEFTQRYPELGWMNLRGGWMHSPDLQDAYLSDRLRLQAYTIW